MYGQPGQQQRQQQQQQPQQQGQFLQAMHTGYPGMGMSPQMQGSQLMSQPTGMPMGMGMGGMGGMGMGMGMGMQQQQQPQRFLSSPQPGLAPQMTGYPGQMQQPQMQQMQQQQMPQQQSGFLGAQPTGYPGAGRGGLMAQPTGYQMPMMTGMPMNPQLQLMSTQFMPSNNQTFVGGMAPANDLSFSSQSMAPSNFQNQIQSAQQSRGGQPPKVPWALSKEERKSYDSIFRAWDPQGTGFVSGDVAREVFGQSGLDRDRLMQVWHLSDQENRGKLNLAEFHVAMGLIYRALNGNDLPETLPQELIPPSARDLNESVDFLKDLLKRDANVRQATALNLPEAGSNSGINYTKAKSFHQNPVEAKPRDAGIYKFDDKEESTGYKSSSRHIDRQGIRFAGQSSQDDLAEMKRQLANTQKMLDGQAAVDERDEELDREMEDLRFRIRRVQDDIDYYNRRGGAAAGDSRRKAERELLHLMHERLPVLEKRIEEKDKRVDNERRKQARERDRRNDDYHSSSRRYGDDDRKPESDRLGRDKDGDSRDRYYDDRERNRYDDRDRDRPDGDRYGSAGRDRGSAPPPPAPPASSSASAPPPPAPPAAASPARAAGPPANMTPAERQAWQRAEAQRRVQERMRALGAMAPAAPSPPPSGGIDSSVEERLAQEKADASERAAKADREAAEREEARRLQLEEQRVNKGLEAVKTVKAEIAVAEQQAQPANGSSSTATIIDAAKQQVDEEEEMFRRREEVLAKEKAARLERLRKLEEAEREAQEQEDAFKSRQAAFQGQPAAKPSAPLPPPARRTPGGKAAAPPPPPSRAAHAPTAPAAPPAPPAPPVAAAVAAPSPSAVSTPLLSTASTNPFHRLGAGASQPAASPAPASPAAAPAGAGTNPFYRMQQGSAAASPTTPSSSLPPAQRAAPAVSAPVVAVTPAATPSSSSIKPVAPSDDDWGDSDHEDDEENEETDGPGSSSRNKRQNLAAALFSSLIPQRTGTPSAGTAAPQSPAPASAPAPPPAPPAPPAPPTADGGAPPPPPPPPAAPPAPVLAASGGGDAPPRSALLGAIQGGLKLRKAVTSDRSSAPGAGAVIGDATPPVQKYVAPPSPPPVAAAEEPVAPASANVNRQSVDWASSLAADQMAPPSAAAQPAEPALKEEDESDDDDDDGPESVEPSAYAPGANGSGGGDSDELDGIDLGTTIRSRALYAYVAQREEDLEMQENDIIVAHPAKESNDNSDWWFGTSLASSKKGFFPKAYVASIEQPTRARAIYDYAATSPEEASLSVDQEVSVVDSEDGSWWRIDAGNSILIVPASYLEVITA
ncbi:unnamed protein product [Tilletia controversa]|nr:hypothetical protein CF328_g1686 [Tilletia controversa]CAD6985087.1 unnamed protein product [Tilletia controversa]